MTEETVFAAALAKKTPTERAAFLDEACSGDVALRQRVEALLQSHDHEEFLRTPAVTRPEEPTSLAQSATDGLTTTPESTTPTERAATMIGPYKLLQQIGEGGMGTVYMAEQTHPVRRTVAIKLIKDGMDDRQVLARFGAERQALALMDHPNIAKVFDAGATEQGRHYFVMELVKGIPITRFCDERRLTLRERLELAIPVCQAVQHAHQKGIIHRDLKPSNVLIALYDGKPVPKVIDFGVAKATGARLTDQTLYTDFGSVVGTLEYMSPEQAELNQLDIDTRSDIYSLGVLLYELLTGSTPLERKQLKTAVFLEVLRMIREEDSPPPSARLSTTEELPNIAACRHVEPRKLSGLVRGELDWIVMKALEKDRNRRYETANGLAADLRHYLDDEPVEACPPSAGYRLRKLVRRHRGLVLAAALVLLALLAGVIGTTWGLIRADQARRAEAAQRMRAEANELKAVEQSRIAEAVRNFLQQDLLRQAGPTEQADAVRRVGGGFEATENPTIKELLDRAAPELTPRKIESKFPSQPEVQASILKTVGATYWSIGEFAKSVDFLTRSSDIFRRVFGADHPDTLSTLEILAAAILQSGNTVEAVALFEQVRDARAKKLGADHPDTLTTLDNLARSSSIAGNTAEAIARYEQVRDARLKKLGADHPDTLTTLDNLARAYLDAGKTAEAVSLFQQVRDARLNTLGADHPDTLMTLFGLAQAYASTGKTAEAMAVYEQVRDACMKKLGADHPQTLVTLHDLAHMYRDTGKTAEAVALYEQVRDTCMRKLGADHPLTLATLDNLAWTYLLTGKTAEAIALLERVRDARVKLLGADHPHTLITLNKLAQAYRVAGKPAEAIALYEQVRAIQVKKFGTDHPDVLTTLATLALVYEDAGKRELALPLFQQAVTGIEKRQFVHPQAGLIVDALSECYERLNQFDQAETWRRKWLVVVKARSGAKSRYFASELAVLGLNLLAQKKWTDAATALHDCLAIRDQQQPDDWTTFNAQSMLGEALYGQKKFAEAEPLLVRSYEGMKQRATKIPNEGKHRLAEALDRLVQLYDAWGKPNEATRWRRELETVKADAKSQDRP
jgi:eukaryotic-like serine/threonine-protein kinase